MFYIKYKLFLLSVLLGLAINSYCFSNSSILPEPSGSYRIGTTEFFINDTVLNNNQTKRIEKSIYVKIWYPSDSVVSKQNYNKYMQGYNQDELCSTFKLIGASKSEVEEICNSLTYSKENLPISGSQDKFPLVIFTPGCFFGLSDLYTSFTENLASNGYIVCSIVHIHDQICIEGTDEEDLELEKLRIMRAFFQLQKTEFFTFKNFHKEENREYVTRKILKKLTRFNQLIQKWEEETFIAINVLKRKSIEPGEYLFHKIDFDNIGTMGQSLGGSLSNHLCVSYNEIKAGVNLDCFQFGNVVDSDTNKPLMLIESDFLEKWQIGNRFVYRNVENLDYLQFNNSTHFMFCDLPFFEGIIPKQKMKIYIGEVDGKFAIGKINESVLLFFDKNLKGNKVIEKHLTNNPPALIDYPVCNN